MQKAAFALVLSLVSSAASASPPAVLANALDGYLQDGADLFLPLLLKGSPLEGDKATLSQSNMIRQIESFYGDPFEWEILAICGMTDRVRTTYYIIYYDDGPVYGFLDSYIKENGSEIANTFLFNTEASQILPARPFTQEALCGTGKTSGAQLTAAAPSQARTK